MREVIIGICKELTSINSDFKPDRIDWMSSSLAQGQASYLTCATGAARSTLLFKDALTPPKQHQHATMPFLVILLVVFRIFASSGITGTAASTTSNNIDPNVVGILSNVTDPTGPKQISGNITRPAAGETVKYGTTYTITWPPANRTSIMIEIWDAYILPGPNFTECIGWALNFDCTRLFEDPVRIYQPYLCSRPRGRLIYRIDQ
jgi:hypothetical protein